MEFTEKAVVRFNNGKTLKGRLKNFAPHHPEIILEEDGSREIHIVSTKELKAIFFVKSFEGDPVKHEKKKYGIGRQRGNRVYIKFKDNEHLVGFLEGDVPWDRGFYLSKDDRGLKGFFLYPVDVESNNIKVFVIASAIADVTVVP